MGSQCIGCVVDKEVMRLRQRVKELENEVEAERKRRWDGNADSSREIAEISRELAALKAGQGEPVAWSKDPLDADYRGWITCRNESGGDYTLALYSAPTIPEGWTQREIELFDGMIEVQANHAERCDMMANRVMAEKQKEWDLERIALLKKCKAMIAAAPKPEE